MELNCLEAWVMTITDIETKLQQMEPGMFQDMCNEILCKMNYTPYDYTGSHTGTHKTIKGTPDALFEYENNWIYVEYTTKKTKLIDKISEDIVKCIGKIEEQKLNKKK